ncbi:hypothetical protein BDY19DRAFT_519961 [Irpex rosettiformis]|uniref:Uncharacterized protein n=1 Tax=Irpex rosettiformis TaxID=378272 RepID=A0ACB8TRB9_9APHY|nr:hypothetical protein BDY19DRAFT_519961 [Irpex rosettiformis]
MRNSILSRPPLAGPSSQTNLNRSRSPATDAATPTLHDVPTIRFISSHPSENIPVRAVAPFSNSTPLAPRQPQEGEPARKRLVPKKSRLGLLATKTKERVNRDLSDIARRVGADTPSSGRGGFEIYVDHDEEEEGSIIVVQKKKSRLGLDGMKWGTLGEVTNVPHVEDKEDKENSASSSVVPKAKKSMEGLFKGKGGEENQKWWSIGRGRKEVKEKKSTDTIQPRSKTPDPFKPSDTRSKFNSLDAGVLLSDPKPEPRRKSSVATLLGLPERSKTPSAEQDLDTPTNEPNASTTGSIALRAMRSVRSLAHMTSWATMRSSSTSSDKEGNHVSDVTTSHTNSSTTVTTGKTKAKSDEKKKKKRKEEKDKESTKKEKKGEEREEGDKGLKKEKKKRSLRLRPSASSFEGGSLTRQASMIMMPPAKAEQTVKKKQSTLGLGMPSTMKLSAMRSSSNLSAHNAPQKDQDTATIRARLSSDSAHLVMGSNGRPASSVSSSSSSFRPPSTLSGVSAFAMRSPRSSNGSVASVRWDEAGLQTVKEMQRRERERRRQSIDPPPPKSTHETKESKRASDGRRRATIADIFPEVRQQPSQSSLQPAKSITPIEEVSVDSVEEVDLSIASVASTVKKARRRPMSEQMFGKPRPKPISDDGDGVKSILDAATDELASLIDRLDLEATPAGSRNGSPAEHTAIPLGRSISFSVPKAASALKGKAKVSFNPNTDAPLLETMASHTSLRPHTTAQSNNMFNPAASSVRKQTVDITDHRKLVGKQIAPWPTLDWQVSPKRLTSKPSSTFRSSQRRSMSPQREESLVAFEPLIPAARRRLSQVESLPSTGTPTNMHTTGVPSSSTFGSGTNVAKIGKQPSVEFDDDEPTPPSPSPPAARHSKRHSRKSSVLSAMCDSGAILPPEAMKSLGLAGSMSGKESEAEAEDPDSDIPDELQNILSGQSDDESVHAFKEVLSYRRHSNASIPGVPPLAALPLPQTSTEMEESPTPIFRATLIDDQDCETDIDDADAMDRPREDDTYKSFDFTGELQKLISDSGPSDRRSFVEQLENAFRTPVDVDLNFSLERELFLNKDDYHPNSPASDLHHNTPVKDAVFDPEMSSSSISMSEIARSDSDHSHSYCHSTDTLDHLIRECEEDICLQYPIVERSPSPIRPKESDGKLNMSFKFGGAPSISDVSVDSSDKPMTLSDIIPPIAHQSPSISFVTEDSSVLRSIFGQTYEDNNSAVKSNETQANRPPFARNQILLRPRPRLGSDVSSKRLSRDLANLSNSFGHSRNTSDASFTGLENFEEVRRGFEFHPNANRSTFYPPPGATSYAYHNRFSVYSVASMSSYGEAFNSGAIDPFGYASSRPTSGDMSMAMSSNIDDTFSFMKKNNQRLRLDSDASSFYFRPTASSHPYRRSRLCNEVNFSALSNGPPVSIYNRSFGVHRLDDSSSSISPVAQSSVMQSSQGRPTRFAHHRQEPSTDSIMSDFSAGHLGRPDIGDKMFDRDYGMTLSSISASPPDSLNSFGGRFDQRAGHDSIFPEEMNQLKAPSEDSLPVFSEDDGDVFSSAHSDAQQDAYQRLRQFRPLSMISVSSTHSSPNEDDTMISMLGGGHVRRRSIDSGIDRSPCNNKERKKRTALQHLARVLRFDESEDEPASVSDIPDRLSKVFPMEGPQSQASSASASSEHLPGERMTIARNGQLQMPGLGDSAPAVQDEELLRPIQSTETSSRPTRTGRSRSSTASSGGETPPLLASDCSSVSSGSQYSIDIGQLNALLKNAAQSSTDVSRTATVRARPPGTGHRRRFSQIRASRTSVYETIQEESVILSSPQSFEIPTPPSVQSKVPSAASSRESVIIVDPESGESYEEYWDEASGLMTMRRYCALREEAQETVTESKRVWHDTPFSVVALQSFQPPKNKTAMRELLEESKQNYGPLPSELRPHRVRSRTSSRVSPYPVRPRIKFSPERKSPGVPFSSGNDAPVSNMALREISINPHFPELSQPSTLDFKSLPQLTVQPETSKPDKDTARAVRPRVTSGARKATVTKRTRKSSNKSDKENTSKENTSRSSIMSTSSSLRLSRPRPRGTIPGRKVNQAA